MRTLLSLGMAVALSVLGSPGSVQAQSSGAAAAPEKKADTKKAASRNVSGTVRSASADALVVTGKDKGRDAEWTFALEPATNIRKGSKSITGGDLKAGDVVQVRFAEQNGKATAQSILVKAAKKDPKR